MKLQNLTVIFIIIILPVILLLTFYISTGLKTIDLQRRYDSGLQTAVHDAIYAFELNTTNDVYKDNAETKRNILKSSVKQFEKSLANTCGISSYNASEIEEYIPAIAFGMYDGFYMYAPSLDSKTNTYKHSLKNYVYYSETLDDGTVIRYSLDNYVVVTGEFEDTGGGTKYYHTKSGYLIVEDTWKNYINNSVTDAKKYYDEAIEFTNWFLTIARIQEKEKDSSPATYLDIKSSNDPESNDPEDESSAFVQHKRKIMKEKMESVLNSSITAYSTRTGGQNYKMPKLSEDDWERIYTNISMVAFFQGKQIGLTKYNGYCVLNSTNSNEYVNPNLMYFINGADDTDHYYHDIRCNKIKEVTDASKLTGYKIGDFQKIKLDAKLNDGGTQATDIDGNLLYNNGTDDGTISRYKYNHMSLACYDCINGHDGIPNRTVYDYVTASDTDMAIKTAYWTSLARERYNTTKLLETK